MRNSEKGKSANATAIAWGYAAGRVLAPTPWKVLMVLARRVSNKRDDFEVWPDQKQIADDAGLSLSTVQRQLKVLADEGYFIRRRRRVTGGCASGHVYVLNVKAAFQMPDGTVEQYVADDACVYVTDDVCENVTGDVCNMEHKKQEHKNEEEPLPLAGQVDMFAPPEANLLSDSQIADVWTDTWNRMVLSSPKLSPITRMGPDRVKELARRVDEHVASRSPQEVNELLRTVVERVAGSMWLSGEKRDGWPAPAAWVTKKANFNKLVGGFYVQDRNIASGGRADRGESTTASAGRKALDLVRRSLGARP